MFERAALEQWFRLGNRTNRVTNERLPSLVLTPDRPLRGAIEEYVHVLGEACLRLDEAAQSGGRRGVRRHRSPAVSAELRSREAESG